MNEEFVIIHGIKYIPVDKPLEQCDSTCTDCDILKASPITTMFSRPLCCTDKYKHVNKSCSKLFTKGIKRIWKIK